MARRTSGVLAIGTTGLIALALIVLGFSALYWKVLYRLSLDWVQDDNYSHGWLIAPIAAWFVLERWNRLAPAPIKPSILGLGVVVISVMTLAAGELGAELFLTRVSILGVIGGSILFVLGWAHLRILFLPVAFLLLMIPIPAIIFNQIAFPLQLLASRFGETTLQLMQIPVLREGNVITLANTQLEVAEACSGIRSLISLLTLGIVYGYFMHPSAWVRTVLALATIPVAILANGFRVAGTGIAAHYYGPEAAEGFFHTFSGWLVFLAAFLMLFVVHRVIAWWAPPPPRTPEEQPGPSAPAAPADKAALATVPPSTPGH